MGLTTEQLEKFVDDRKWPPNLWLHPRSWADVTDLAAARDTGDGLFMREDSTGYFIRFAKTKLRCGDESDPLIYTPLPPEELGLLQLFDID